MNRNPINHGLDGESLQTDVMRFMAIIAFCLIAILSLVRDVESQPTVVEATNITSTDDASIEPVLLPLLQPRESPEPEPAPRLPVPEPRLVPLVALPEPDTEQVPTSIVIDVTPQTPLAKIVALEAEKEKSVPAPRPQVDDTQSEGLTLRFVSDSDFLRLIAKGDVRVYAFQDQVFLALGDNYEFQDATAPKQVYEVLPETIPSLIDSALAKRDPSPTAFKWGISLPKRVERQIQRYLNTVSTGQLLIDRYGEVHHVAAR